MKKYADEYETVVILDADGHEKTVIEYRGKYFECAFDKEDLDRFRRNCYVLLAMITILHISAGFVANRGMYQLYVALPYVFAFFPLLYLAMGVLRLPKEKRLYRRDEIRLSYDRMKNASMALVIILGIGVLGEIVFLLLVSDGSQSMLEYLYLALEVFTASFVYLLIRLQRDNQVQACSEQKPQ
ncbi:MAG: hypothetical protein JXR32_02560 [Anaerolineaceae bacterium]|nr:hypothetical protein [Anaerolineaceae bacterium]